ncbi:hypothetical protein DY000_02058456 [Brassica cretica]|uniref:Uncharacterized protein n=2 Tax=Brassica cretica TaxID=69181 RepID=A0ABQ7B0J4_BRACR|nr:hypothetical protein DY000_02058456 [Brassica cretica]
MPSNTRSNKDKYLLFSEDPAHLEHTIRKDQRSTSLDAAAFMSSNSRTQPSTDTRPSSSTDLHRSTSIDTTPRTSIDHQSRNMVAIVILRQDENGNLYDQDGHLRNATGQKLDAQGNVIIDTDATGAAQPVEEAARPRALADYNRPDEYYANRSAIRLPEIQKQNFELKPQYYTLVSQMINNWGNGEGDTSADEEQPANRRRIEVILSQQTLSSDDKNDDKNDDTPVLEDLRDVLKRKFEPEDSNSSKYNDLRTTLDARKSRRISTGDLRDKLNAGACDLCICLNRSKSTNLRRRLEQTKTSSNDTPL